MLTRKETCIMRGGGATKKLFVALLVVLLTALMLTPPAFGAVKDPRSIEVFHGRDFVGLQGYPANTMVRVDVLRGPDEVVVGSTIQRTDGTGLLEINHLGEGQFPQGDCWGPTPNVTPDILPGDKVQSTILDGGGLDTTDVDFTVTRDIFMDTDATTVDPANNTITVNGHVRSLPNAPINIAGDVLELRLNANGFTWQSNDNRKDLRDNVSAADFEADGDGDPTTFVHVFSVTDPDADNANTSGFEQAFEWSSGGAAEEEVIPEITVFDGIEQTPGCPPLAKTAITDASTHSVAGKAVVNSSNVANDMVVGGVAFGATSVSVSIPGGAAHEGVLTPVDPAAPEGNQTWTATIPASELGDSLPQGRFNITANFTGDGVPASSSLSALKDTVAPAAATATPAGGFYNTAQAVSLESNEADANIHYTTNGSEPTSASRIFTSQIQVTASQTIKAKVFDAAGNASDTATFDYTIDNLAPSVSASPAGGTYTAAQSVTLTASEPADIYYTTNGTDPLNEANIGRTKYSGPINISGTTTLKYAAVDRAGNRSAVATETYTINITITAPGAPINVTATAGNTTATVNWTLPANNGGRAITEYRVRVYNSAGTLLRNVAGIPGSANSAQVTNLTNGTAYKFKVQASNTPDGQTNVWGAESAFSNTVTPTAGTTPGTLPGAPIIGTAVSGVTSDSAISATAKWSPPTNNGGSAITGYRVKAIRVTSTGALHSTQPANPFKNAGTATQLKFTGLVSGAFYKFEVQASNTPAGQTKVWGPASAQSNQVTAR